MTRSGFEQLKRRVLGYHRAKPGPGVAGVVLSIEVGVEELRAVYRDLVGEGRVVPRPDGGPVWLMDCWGQRHLFDRFQSAEGEPPARAA